MASEQPLGVLANLDDLEARAQKRMDPGAFGYIAGGSESETTLRRSRGQWDDWALVPRVMRGLGFVDPAWRFLADSASMPVAVAPMALHTLAHTDGEVATAGGAADAGVPFVASTLSGCSIEQIAQAGAGPTWQQVYVFRDRNRTRQLVARAQAAGCAGLVLTVDLPVSGRRERDIRSRFALPPSIVMGNFPDVDGNHPPQDIVAAWIDPALSWEDIGWLADLSQLPVWVKGVLHPDDARQAVAAGAAGVIVSNHGGRQLDHGLESAHALAPIADAVGAKAPVLVDGGVRRGTDVLKALALGAQGVLIGRPMLWALALAGRAGVAQALDHLRTEIAVSMHLLGVAEPGDVSSEHVRRLPL